MTTQKGAMERNILQGEMFSDDRGKGDDIISSHKIMKRINGPKLWEKSLSMVSRMNTKQQIFLFE